MSLELTLILPQPDVALGAELPTELVLTNIGATAVETASLFDNNLITNYVLSDELDRRLTSVNQVTRQTLFEKTEPNTTAERSLRLDPGQSEKRQDNFCRYHWLSRPGVYHLRGAYRYRGQELLSPPVRFQVHAAPLHALDVCWNYHYAERFTLYSAWCAPQHDGQFQVLFRESARFSPQVINSNAPLATLAYPVRPRISFNRSALGGGAVWLAYLDASEPELGRLVLHRRHPTGGIGPIEVELPHADLQWVQRPLCAKDDGVLCLLRRRDEDGDIVLWSVLLDAAGNELERSEVTVLDPSTRFINVTCDADGGVHLITWDEITREIVCRTLNWSPCGVASETRLGVTEQPVIALLTPPLLGPEKYVVTLSADAGGAAVCFEWWQLGREGDPIKRQLMPYATPQGITACNGAMDATHPICLLRGDRRLDYLQPRLNQSVCLWQGEGPEPMQHEQLIINGRRDVFLSRSTPSVGITDRRLHLGSDFDLAEVMTP